MQRPEPPIEFDGLGVIIVAAGSGTRFGDTDKVFAPLGGIPLLVYSLDLFTSVAPQAHVVVVLGAHTLTQGDCLIAPYRTAGKSVAACIGGETRSDSVRRGLAALPSAVSLIAVHDAARPLASAGLVRRVVAAARDYGAATPVVAVSDTIHVAHARTIAETPDRSLLWAAQTPQVARRDWLEVAYQAADSTTDDAGLLHTAGFPVQLVAGEPENIKITYPRDMLIAQVLLHSRQGAEEVD